MWRGSWPWLVSAGHSQLTSQQDLKQCYQQSFQMTTTWLQVRPQRKAGQIRILWSSQAKRHLSHQGYKCQSPTHKSLFSFFTKYHSITGQTVMVKKSQSRMLIFWEFFFFLLECWYSEKIIFLLECYHIFWENYLFFSNVNIPRKNYFS